MTSVLVIDDDRDFCITIRESLETAGYHVRTAYDGESGVREFERAGADVVLLDVIMPGRIEGVETMGEIHGIAAATPIIVMSGGGGTSGPEHYLASAEALGAAATLSKPFERSELIGLLEQFTAA